jgi:regulator of protease activity HflC (stomatin/prohibitin superfamily)
LSAEGEKEANVLISKGQAEASIIKAEAEKRAIELLMYAFRNNQQENLIMLKYLEMFPKLAEGKGVTIVVPDQLSNIANLGSVASKIFNNKND